MQNKALTVSLAAALALAIAAGCAPPKNNTPVADIPKITKLSEVMEAQATTADPQFSKRDQEAFTAEEFAALGETGAKIEATSTHLKDFSKGPEWDALALRLNGTAVALSKAATDKDAAGARKALTEMKATCKECHSKLR
ncbi:hypothetical protein BH09MYX1_BH09MYX1_67470 [soil metagenome]